MASILPMDELNRLDSQFRAQFGDAPLPNGDKELVKEVEDLLLDFFIYSYAMGNSVTNENLDGDWTPDADEVEDVINAEVAGKTWKERVEDYFASGGTGADISRIAATESHRISNKAAYDTAKKAGATTKIWNCMMLPTSRDTHIYLNGVSAPIDGEFYSFKGGKTKYPGQWGIAEEDVNCLCWLSFSKG